MTTNDFAFAMDNAGMNGTKYPVELLRPREYLDLAPNNSAPRPGARVNPIINAAAEHLIQLAQKHFEAVNARDFSPTSPVWQDKAPWWQAEIGILSDRHLNLVEYVEEWKNLASRYPDYTISLDAPNLQDAAKIEVNLKAGTAEMYVTGEISGMPKGLTRAFVGIVSWKMIDEKWYSTKFQTMHGGQDG